MMPNHAFQPTDLPPLRVVKSAAEGGSLSLVSPIVVFAGEISDFDIATYSLTARYGQPA